MQSDSLFLGTMLQHQCMLSRLLEEIREASREFRNDPMAFVRSALRGDAVNNNRRTMLLRFGLALGILFYALLFAATLIGWSISQHRNTKVDDGGTLVIRTPIYFPSRIKDGSGSDGETHGGGGGGDKKEAPASWGQSPTYSLDPSIVAPRPEQQLTPPALPVTVSLLVDPKLDVKRDDLAPTGLIDGVVGPPSAGPGEDKGIGTGKGGGVGQGKGRGEGEGEDGNKNGGRFELGGPRGSGAGAVVDSRPVLLNQPRPLYTELARLHKIEGTVRVRVLISSEGRVQQVALRSGLPDGLNEQAIQAASLMRFKPAIRNGQPVAFWLNVEIEFNLR